MKRPTYERCLITGVTRLVWPSPRYYVNTLQASTANMATKTGIACTVSMTKEQIEEAKKMHGLKTLKSLVGAPIICKVEFGGGNVLGSSRFHKNTY